jgi:hypothetical protein
VALSTQQAVDQSTQVADLAYEMGAPLGL